MILLILLATIIVIVYLENEKLENYKPNKSSPLSLLSSSTASSKTKWNEINRGEYKIK